MKTNYIIVLTLLLFTLTISAIAAPMPLENKSRNELKINATPEIYDSLISDWHTRNINLPSLEHFVAELVDIDTTITLQSSVPDSIYKQRLDWMISPIHLPYNDIVRRYIVAYTISKKELMQRIIGLSQYYFPIFESELDRNDMPLELRMLPVIESALSASITSRAGACGLWQFMLPTGRAYGLEVTTFVDQRRDPVASTKAACRYLSDLYKIYGDWTLALAAYNCGPGNVNKAIKRTGGNAKTYWDIYPYLPKETRGYIPSFIAATYAYQYHKEHDMTPVPPPQPLSTDTITIHKPMHLEQISSTIDTSIDILRSLNPQYKKDIIPASGKAYTLILPLYDINKFIDKEIEIYAKDSVYLSQYLAPNGQDVVIPEIVTITHKVKNGDTLGAIARKNGVTVTQLMKWNNLKTANSLRIGQSIKIEKK